MNDLQYLAFRRKMVAIDEWATYLLLFGIIHYKFSVWWLIITIILGITFNGIGYSSLWQLEKDILTKNKILK